MGTFVNILVAFELNNLLYVNKFTLSTKFKSSVFVFVPHKYETSYTVLGKNCDWVGPLLNPTPILLVIFVFCGIWLKNVNIASCANISNGWVPNCPLITSVNLKIGVVQVYVAVVAWILLTPFWILIYSILLLFISIILNTNPLCKLNNSLVSSKSNVGGILKLIVVSVEVKSVFKYPVKSVFSLTEIPSVSVIVLSISVILNETLSFILTFGGKNWASLLVVFPTGGIVWKSAALANIVLYKSSPTFTPSVSLIPKSVLLLYWYPFWDWTKSQV